MSESVPSELLSLDNSGERMVPAVSHESVFWAHVYRYQFAAQYCRGKRVLDIACGEGYGSHGLKTAGAASVVGVDISARAVDHARAAHGIDARIGSAEAIPVDDQSLDVIVSFETIEHLAKPQRFILECNRVLTPAGTLIISTPNRDGLVAASVNAHHEQEMDCDELARQLQRCFAGCTFFGQYLRSASWWTTRSLSAENAVWSRVPGSGRVRRLAARVLRVPSVVEPSTELRSHPEKFIATRPRALGRCLDRYAILPLNQRANEVPAFLICVARRKLA